MINGYSLSIQWFKNVFKNEINDEILLIYCNNKSQVNCYQKKFENLQIDNLKIVHNIEASYDNLSGKQNFLILGEIPISINFSNKKPIIFLTIKDFILSLNQGEGVRISKEKIFEAINSINTKKLSYDSLETIPGIIIRRDPIQLIHAPIYNIQEITSNFALFNEFYRFSTSMPHFNKRLELDISILVKYNKLTSRLAIVLYKICTFEFSASNTRVGRFYASQLGRSSIPYHIPKELMMQYPYLKCNKIKAYSLDTPQ